MKKGVCEICGGMCTKCCAGTTLIVGLLLGAWVLWFPQLDWRLFFGGLLVLGGLLKYSMPCCPHCE